MVFFQPCDVCPLKNKLPVPNIFFVNLVLLYKCVFIYTFQWGKRLLVPLLRLKEGLLQVVSLPFPEPSAKMLRSASSRKGIRKWGNKLITSDNNNEGHHIDMIILGSVAVDKKGKISLWFYL